MHVRRLHPADATTVRDLRLRGLQESPTAFGSSYEEEVDHPIATIAESLAEPSGRATFGAFTGDTLAGIVSLGRETAVKEQHRGFIRGMYVQPESRRLGVGSALLAEAMRAARGMPGLRQVTLAVTAGNLAAIATYEGCGFKAYGTAPQALHVQGRYYDEIHMVCHLDAG